ncbi:MAG TPA: methylated-DNA--[protein]-cysteine S-methyltransferase [Gaiellaceae bacterium]|jgi:methylated-DNA-[protein]-cysteine S-methyltransferase
MKPTLVRYDAPGFGVGEVWLEGARVVWAELPRPGASPLEEPSSSPLGVRLSAFFAGEPDDFVDVELDYDDGFYGDCARALRALPRGEVVTYGELAALAGRPGAARAAGTFCARNRLSPFVPCHRVVASNGIGSYGSLGIEYKRRLLALEDVAL